MEAVKIKICGITNLQDAQAAIACGADWLGLIFAEESPRKIKAEAAREIIRSLKGRATFVGVFKDGHVSVINRCAADLGLDMVQLHGRAPAQLCKEIERPVIKSIEIPRPLPRAGDLVALARKYEQAAAHVLFDRPKEDKSDSWLLHAIQTLRAVESSLPPYMVAGGLSADNVSMLLEALHPTGVDVASGVESSHGKKDPEKLRAFCDAVKSFRAKAENEFQTREVGHS